MSADQWFVFLPAAVLVAASPGANNLLAFRNGLRSGLAPAAVALLGRFGAFTLMLTPVVAGLGTLLARSQLLFELLRWAGAVYLVGLGVHVLWTRRRGAAGECTDAGPRSAEPASARSVRRLAVQEFLTAGANPKALLLFTAFLPQFVRAGQASTWCQLLALGTAYIAVEGVTALSWAAAGRLLASRDLTTRALVNIDRASGALFVALGAGLAATSNPRPAR